MRAPDLRNHSTPSARFAIAFACACAVLSASAGANAQTIWHVDDDAPLGGNGTSWTTAFTYLQDGLAAATGGDEIWVAAGTYTPDQGAAQSSGDKFASFVLIDGVSIFGGFAGNEEARNERNPAANETVLSGDLGNNDGTGVFNDNSFRVTKCILCAQTAAIFDVTITSGRGADPDENRFGGGMYIQDGNPLVAGCRFIKNEAERGGGLYLTNASNPNFFNCSFIDNFASVAGGGVSMSFASGFPVFVNCLFWDNRVAGSGPGGAMHNESASFPTMINCTIAGNSSQNGGAVANFGGSPVVITNSVIFGNTTGIAGLATVNYSLIQGGFAGIGNLGGDPMFVSVSDFHLQDASPCIDVGSNPDVPADLADLNGNGNVVEPTPLDLDRNSRFVDDPFAANAGVGPSPIVDMGSYEFSRPDCDENGILDECEVDCGEPGGPCDVSGCGEIMDCNGNDAPDECDIAGCPAGTPECADCNGNEKPDVCDMTGTVMSAWVGGTECGLAPDFECWNVAENWCPPVVPINSPDSFLVTISVAGAVATLDLNPNVTALSIGPSASLEVNAGSGAVVERFLQSDSVVTNAGTIRAKDGLAFLFSAADVDQADTGLIEATGTDSEVRILGRQVTGGTVRGVNGGIVTLDGALVGVTVEGVVVPNGGTASITGTIETQGDFVVAGDVGDVATLQPTASDALLQSAGGRLTLSSQDGSLLGSIFDSGTLTNDFGHTVEGEGLIVGTFGNDGLVVANSSGRTLKVASPGTKSNSGVLRATGGGMLSIRDVVTQTPTGLIEATAGGIVEIDGDNGGGVMGGALRAVGGIMRIIRATITLIDDIDLPPGSDSILEVDGSTVTGATALNITGGLATLTNGADVTIDGVISICPAPGAVAELHVIDSSISAQDLEICDGGVLEISNTTAQSRAGDPGTMSLSGSFSFSNTNEADWTWSTGSSLEMTGGTGLPPDDPTGYPELEIGGEDFGDDPGGFVDNFDLPELVIGPDAHVSLVDTVDNGNRVDHGFGVQEALYVATLQFVDTSGRLNLNGLNLYYGTILPPGGENQIVGRRIVAPLAASHPHDRRKNRYISFDPNKTGGALRDGNDGIDVAFKVELLSINMGSCDDGTGAQGGNVDFCRSDRGAADCKACSGSGDSCISAPIDCPPGESCDPTGATCVNDAPNSGGSNVAMIWWVGPEKGTATDPDLNIHLLVSEPFRKVSDNWPNPVHAGDCEVVPQAAYGVRAVEAAGGAESDELVVSTTALNVCSVSGALCNVAGDCPAGETCQPVGAPAPFWWGDVVGVLTFHCSGDIREQTCDPNTSDGDCTGPGTPAACCTGAGTGLCDCPGGDPCERAWELPNGVTNLDDVTAALWTSAPAPPTTVSAEFTWVDVHGNDSFTPGSQNFDPPNNKINASDLQQIISGFGGFPYRFYDPADCPDTGAWP